MLSVEARQHLETYWRLSIHFFQEGDFALATFFAITLIEEIGKVVILVLGTLGIELDNKALYDHQRKYAIAVHSTLLLNTRVLRIYGKDETKFSNWLRDGELFKIRNQALYMQRTDADITVPRQAVSREDAFLVVCIAGEVYAELQGKEVGTGPREWRRILREVDTFREKNGKKSRAKVQEPSRKS